MSTNKVRVRFAPSPTGIMHLGNIRAALINYLYARQKNGVFILRIEDTDQSRNYDLGAKQIMHDLAWLNLEYDEGPIKGGPHAPYFQSERNHLYQENLDILKNKNLIYRCFCTEQELEQKRLRQVALKQPPRYDRTCLKLSEEQINKKLQENIPFCWRMKLDHGLTITIQDISRGPIKFELKNFTDFLLTRTDGSFTFMFANFVDDMLMEITHIFRGEDHLSNTAGQAALYLAFNKELPFYWHLPIICNTQGQKLSKRDFGFSLKDLQEAGYLPEAICNYLTIIGTSFEEEIMPMPVLIEKAKLDNPTTAGLVKYDVNKLTWLNRKWIALYDPQKLAVLCKHFIEAEYPAAQALSQEKLAYFLQQIKSDMSTLKDCVAALAFYFKRPAITVADIDACIAQEKHIGIISAVSDNLGHLENASEFVEKAKQEAAKLNVDTKNLFWFLRLALIGSTKGPAIHLLIEMLGTDESFARIKAGFEILTRA